MESNKKITLTDAKGNMLISIESSPVKSQEGVGAVIGTILVLPYVLAAIGYVIFGIATRISDAKSNSVFKSFAKENKDLISKITKILTDKLNELLKIKEPLKADATRIANSINSIDKNFYNFVPDLKEIDKYFSAENFVSKSLIVEIIKAAKEHSGNYKFDTGSLDIVWTGCNWDWFFENVSEKDIEDSKYDDGWAGYFDKAMDASEKHLKELKKKYPISDTNVYIAGDDFGGELNVTFEFNIDLTEIHSLLKTIDISKLNKF